MTERECRSPWIVIGEAASAVELPRPQVVESDDLQARHVDDLVPQDRDAKPSEEVCQLRGDFRV